MEGWGVEENQHWVVKCEWYRIVGVKVDVIFVHDTKSANAYCGKQPSHPRPLYKAYWASVSRVPHIVGTFRYYCASRISDLLSYHVKQGCWIGLKVVLFRSSDLVWAFLWSAWGILRDCRCSSESEECRKKEKMEGKVKTEPRAVQTVSW